MCVCVCAWHARELHLPSVTPKHWNPLFLQAPSMNFADILVPRARDNVTAIEMVAKEIARRVETAQVAARQSKVSVAA